MSVHAILGLLLAQHLACFTSLLHRRATSDRKSGHVQHRNVSLEHDVRGSASLNSTALSRAFSNIKLTVEDVIGLEQSPGLTVGFMTSVLKQPDLSTIDMRKGKYDGYLLGSGVSLSGDRELMALRVCTSGCHFIPKDAGGKGEPVDNAIAIGELHRQGSRSFEIRNLREEPILHAEEGKLRGPEDARLDVLDDKVFLYFNMNPRIPEQLTAHEIATNSRFYGMEDFRKCPNYESGQLRKMYFKWLGDRPDQACMLQLPGANQCRTEKNWASLVVPGVAKPFFVYSVSPFQAFQVDSDSCQMNQVSGGSLNPDPDMNIRGSTRYVQGVKVPEGTIYWALTHSSFVPSTSNEVKATYTSHISSVLVRHKGKKMPYKHHCLTWFEDGTPKGKLAVNVKNAETLWNEQISKLYKKSGTYAARIYDDELKTHKWHGILKPGEWRILEQWCRNALQDKNIDRALNDAEHWGQPVEATCATYTCTTPGFVKKPQVDKLPYPTEDSCCQAARDKFKWTAAGIAKLIEGGASESLGNPKAGDEVPEYFILQMKEGGRWEGIVHEGFVELQKATCATYTCTTSGFVKKPGIDKLPLLWPTEDACCQALLQAKPERCSSFKFGINFCSDWCNKPNYWGCGEGSMAASDPRNRDKKEYRCDCKGCNGCHALLEVNSTAQSSEINSSEKPQITQPQNAAEDFVVYDSSIAEEEEDTPSLEYLGTSCAVANDFHKRFRYNYAIPSSIIRFDQFEDVGHVTFLIDDKMVVRSLIHGISGYLTQAHNHWVSTGQPFTCS